MQNISRFPHCAATTAVPYLLHQLLNPILKINKGTAKMCLFGLCNKSKLFVQKVDFSPLEACWMEEMAGRIWSDGIKCVKSRVKDHQFNFCHQGATCLKIYNKTNYAAGLLSTFMLNIAPFYLIALLRLSASAFDSSDEQGQRTKKGFCNKRCILCWKVDRSNGKTY